MANTKGTAERVAENVEKHHNPQKPGVFAGRGSDLVTVAVRLQPGLRTRLRKHFEAQGLKMGQGLRMALHQWAATNRI